MVAKDATMGNMVRYGAYSIRAIWPTKYEDFDEALSHICQTGSLVEFRHLSNRVEGWSEKVLIGVLMGELKEEIAADIRMYKPRT